jgi:Mrp family chromosome partitioning ATPase
MDSSTRMMGKPKGLLQRRAALIAWATVLTIAAVLNAVWLSSDDRSSPNYPLVVGLDLIGGLALALVLAYLWDRRAGRLKDTSEVAAATGLPVLGVVPAIRLKGADRVAVTASQPIEGRQAYGILVAGLGDTLWGSGRKCLLITSPTRGDGRTTTAVNLSTLLAAEGIRVALVSADPNGESVDQVLGLERKPGLTEVLDGSNSLDSALQSGGVDRLRILTAGGPSDEMLGQNLDKLGPLLNRLTRNLDLIVIDAPPVLAGMETVLLAQEVDQVLFVVDVRHGKRSEATTALAYLGHVRDRLVGCVVNDPSPRRTRRPGAASAAEPAAAPASGPTTEPAPGRSVPAWLAAVAAAAAGVGLWLRRGGRSAGRGAGAAAGSARRAARAGRSKLASAASLKPVRRHPWAGVIATALAVAIVVSTVWWLNYDGSTEAQDGSAAPDNSRAALAPSSQATVAAAMDDCRSTRHAQTAPLETASKSLQQWQVHIDAMNQLVAGKITLAQANAFWERTRMQAAHRVHRFHRADGSYTAGQYSCPVLVTAENADRGLSRLSACRRDIAQRDDTLRAARVAIDTWHRHVIDMNMLRAGTLSPARAIRLWNKYWKQGVAELHHYRAQLRQTDNQRC